MWDAERPSTSHGEGREGGPRAEAARRLALVLVALALVAMALAPAASAYSKFEHEQLTFYAFEIARQLVCAVDEPPVTCDGFDETDGILPAELGVVTRAVDYFTNPGRLAPELADCQADPKTRKQIEGRQDLRGCRDWVFQACREPASDEECLGFALEHTRKKVVQRRNKRLYRALAVHRNDEHFRDGAQRAYNTMHERAIRFARQGHHELALVAEAVAIHFLQDGFSPGHLAAPRDQYGDSHAGALHDRYNKRGLQIWIGEGICTAARRLEKPLEALWGPDSGGRMQRAFERVTMKRGGPDGDGPSGNVSQHGQIPKAKRIPQAKRIPLQTIGKDLEDFNSVFCRTRGDNDALSNTCADVDHDHDTDSHLLQYAAFGDKRLLVGSGRRAREELAESRSRHRISLLALAVTSIEDVLGACPNRAPLQLCFHPPTLERRTARKQQDNPTTRFWSPGLAVGPRLLDDPWPPGRFCWPTEQEGLILGFQTNTESKLPNPDRAKTAAGTSPPDRSPSSERWALPAGVHPINSLQAAVSYWGAERRRFEFGHDLVATEKYFERDQSGMLQAVAGRKFVATGGYVLHYERVPDLEVLGGGLLLTSGTQFRDFDIYGALEPGFARYRYAAGDTSRFRWSARAGVGFSILAVEGIVERGFELDPAGGLEKKWRPSVNLRFRVAPSWLALPFQKLKGRGKQPAS